MRHTPLPTVSWPVWFVAIFTMAAALFLAGARDAPPKCVDDKGSGSAKGTYPCVWNPTGDARLGPRLLVTKGADGVVRIERQ